MKKLKALLAAVLVFVLAFTLAGCNTNSGNGGGNGDNEQPTGPATLNRIDINTDNVKKDYYVDDEFTSEGLVVTAYVRYSGSLTLYPSELTSDQYVVDSSEFNSKTNGTYTITVSYTLGEVTRSRTYDVNVQYKERPYSLNINTDNVKKLFNAGEEFTSEGLTATTFDFDYSTNTSKAPYDVSDKLVVDSSAFDSNTVGDYVIKVSYTASGATVEAQYTVSVVTSGGLQVALSEDTYNFKSGGVEIDISDLNVYFADVNGVSETPLDKSDPNLSINVYHGHADNECQLENGKFTASEAGSYNVFVEYEGYKLPSGATADLTGFAIIYVMDRLVGFQFNMNNANAVTTQEQSNVDSMSSTWTYVASFMYGGDKIIEADDPNVSVSLSPNVVTDNGSATVTYRWLNAKGVETVRTCQVGYTITKRYVPSGENKYSFDYDALVENITAVTGTEPEDKTLLKSEYFMGNNIFLSLTGAGSNEVLRDPTKSGGCIEIKSGKLSVDFTGTGTLTIQVASTGATNTSDFALQGADEKYIVGTFDSALAEFIEVQADNSFIVTGDTPLTITFTITKPGTYTMITNFTGSNNRSVRICAVEMIDIVP